MNREQHQQLLVSSYRALLVVDSILEAGIDDNHLAGEDCAAARLGTEIALRMLETFGPVVEALADAPVADKRRVQKLLDEIAEQEPNK